MPFPLAAAIGIGALGDLAAGFLGSHGQQSANRTNIKLQREQQAWEQMMANTAVQRRKADIVAAGGNPALAFVSGQEAATPSIAPARVESETGDLSNALSNATGKAMGLAQARQSILASSAQTRLTTEQARLTADQARNIRADTYLKLTTASKGYQETKNLERINEEIGARISKYLAEADVRRIQAYVAEHTKEETIKAINSGSIIREANIDAAKWESYKGRLKQDLLEMLFGDPADTQEFDIKRK